MSTFCFKDKIIIKIPGFGRHQHGSVHGKIKDKNAYLVSLRGVESDKHSLLRKLYGYPNRHLELEWGNYVGTSEEFIMNGEDIEKYTK